MLIVTQEESLPAPALVAPEDVDTGVLAASVVLQALVHICREKRLGLGCSDSFKQDTTTLQPSRMTSP